MLTIKNKSLNIYQKLINLQADLPAITKEAKNPFYKSNYATLEVIQQTIQPLLAKHGLGYMFMPTIEGLKAVVFDDNQQIDFVYPANLTGKPQEIGSAITYAKRYALCAMLGLIVADEDDDGNKANSQATAKVETKHYMNNERLESVSSEQAAQIVKLLANPETKGRGYAYYKKITSNTQIDVEDYEKIQSALKLAYPDKK